MANETVAEALINSIVSQMESIQPSITPSEVVSFLNIMVDAAPSEMLYLSSLSPMNESTVADSMHAAFSSYLASADPAIASLFTVSTGSTVLQETITPAGGSGALR